MQQNIIKKAFDKYIVPISDINQKFYKNHAGLNMLKIKECFQKDTKNKPFEIFFINAEIRVHYCENENIDKNKVYYKNSIDKIIYIFIDDLNEEEIKTIANLAFLTKEISTKSIILFGRKRDKKPIIDNLSNIFHMLIGAVNKNNQPAFKGGVFLINKNKNKEYEFLMATNIKKTNNGYEQINLPNKYEFKVKFNFSSETLNYIENISLHPIVGNVNPSCNDPEIFPNYPLLDESIVNEYYDLYRNYFNYQGLFSIDYLKNKIKHLNKGILLTMYPSIENVFKNQELIKIIDNKDFILLELYGSGNAPDELGDLLIKIEKPQKYAVSQQNSHISLSMNIYETGRKLLDVGVTPLKQIDTLFAWYYLLFKKI